MLLIYTETGHMYSQARVQLYKVTSEALSRHSEGLSSWPRVAPNVVLCFATAPLHRARTFLFGRGSTAPDDAGISGISRLGASRYPLHGTFGAPISFGTPGTFGSRHHRRAKHQAQRTPSDLRHGTPSVPGTACTFGLRHLPPVATCTRQ